MSIANKYNKSNKFNYTIPENAEYVKLNNLDRDRNYIINALYINTKSEYGDHPVICSNNLLVDLPHHLNDTVKEMIKDDEVISAVNKGLLGFKVRTYKDKKYKRNCFSVEFVDLPYVKTNDSIIDEEIVNDEIDDLPF